MWSRRNAVRSQTGWESILKSYRLFIVKVEGWLEFGAAGVCAGSGITQYFH